MLIRILSLAILFSVTQSFGVDKPGGITKTAVNLPSNTYEVILTPGYTISPGGFYLSSEFRMQPSEDFGVGVGFGAGEIGFHTGGNGMWYILPDTEGQPAFSLMGGMYISRLASDSYFLVKLAPIVSKAFKVGKDTFTPYASYQLVPSFKLGPASNEFTMKVTAGLETIIPSLSGIRLWTEFGVGIMNSAHEVVLGLSYPFAAL
jgi:hypothetical protein